MSRKKTKRVPTTFAETMLRLESIEAQARRWHEQERQRGETLMQFAHAERRLTEEIDRAQRELIVLEFDPPSTEEKL